MPSIFGVRSARAWRRNAAAVLGAAALLGLAAPAQAHWLRAESPRFIVYSNGDARSLQEFTGRLEDFDALLQQMLGVGSEPSPVKLEVYLVEDGSALRQAWPGVSPTIAGFYTATPDAVQNFVRRDIELGQAERDQILFHEYVHHFIAAYLPGAYPTWLNEGLAEYLGSAEFKRDTVVVGQSLSGRSMTLIEGEWMPIEKVICSRGYPEDGFRFYAESWLTTHYLLRSREAAGKLGAYVMAVRAGEDAKTAFPRVMGMDFKTFQGALTVYTNNMFAQVIPKPKRAPPRIDTTELPPSADRMLLTAAYLKQLPSTHLTETLERVQSAASLFPDDPLALKTLARAEILAAEARPEAKPDKSARPDKEKDKTATRKQAADEDDEPAPAPATPDTPEMRAKRLALLDQAKTALDRVLARAPKDVEALDLQGERLMAQGRIEADRKAELYAQARPFFSLAAEADPNSFPTFYYYGRTYADLPGRLSDNTINALSLAHNLAPQVDALAITEAAALIRQERWDDAVYILEPIAYSPHRRAKNDAVQTMLAQARSHLKDKPATKP